MSTRPRAVGSGDAKADVPALQVLSVTTLDNVGVVVVETLDAGALATGSTLDTGVALQIVSANNIPFGHKIALMSIPRGEAVIKQGVCIGQAAAAIGAGEHVHLHNMVSRSGVPS